MQQSIVKILFPEAINQFTSTEPEFRSRAKGPTNRPLSERYEASAYLTTYLFKLNFNIIIKSTHESCKLHISCSFHLIFHVHLFLNAYLYTEGAIIKSVHVKSF